MADGGTLPSWHLRVVDYIGLGCLLLVPEEFHRDYKTWYSWSGFFVAGVVCLWFGDAAPTTWKRLKVRWHAPKALAEVSAENVQLKQQLESLNSSVQPPMAASSRLKIIEARYGIEGINNPDVTHYLLERLHGNSYAELVGADLFHGFDPLPGNPNKKLTVRYSFDSREAGIVRPEHEWLILPEDMFLRKLLDACQQERIANENQARAKLDMFSPLQIEALALRKALIDFRNEVGPEPIPDRQRYPNTPDGEAMWLTAYHQAIVPWKAKLSSGYELRFKGQARKLHHQISAMGITCHRLGVLTLGPFTDERVPELIEELWKAVRLLELFS